MDEVTWERASGDLWVAEIGTVLDELIKRWFFQSSIAPKRDIYHYQAISGQALTMGYRVHQYDV